LGIGAEYETFGILWDAGKFEKIYDLSVYAVLFVGLTTNRASISVKSFVCLNKEMKLFRRRAPSDITNN